MGRLDYWAKRVFNDPQIFANLFNGYLFGGKPVVLPETLNTQNPMEVLQPADNRKVFLQRERDLLKMATCKRGKGCSFLLLGLEAQAAFDPTMPLRSMLYDAVNYTTQVDRLKEANRKAGRLSEEEFIAGLMRGHKLVPVITLVLLLSGGKWIRGRRLHDILDIPTEEIGKYVCDYPLNIITPSSMSDGEIRHFGDDLSSILFAVKHAEDKEALLKVVKRYRPFHHVNYETARLILEIANLDINLKKKKEGIDMAEKMVKFSDYFLLKGIEQGIEKGIEKGIKKGIEKGIEQGEVQGTIKTMLDLGKSCEEICLRLTEKYALTKQEAQKELAKLWPGNH
ncbi:MAG: hypothetical protein IKP00_16900 [Victivallales bacterium]|nr:hypothetical protein [Victivallales bacterium]